MNRLSTRSGIAGMAALLVIAVVAAGGVLYAASRSGGSVNTTAALVPADALIYGVINTDLSSSQWVAAFKLAERLGQKQPQQKLHDEASSSGDLNWERDVVPFLGGDAGIYLRSANQSNGVPSFAIIARCKDSAKAMDTLLRKAGGSFSKASHAGVSYQFNGDSSQYVARLDNYVVVSTDEDSLFSVLDVKSGKQKSMAGVSAFKTLNGRLGSSYLGFFYIDGQRIADDTLQGNSDLQNALSTAGADFALKPFGLIVTAKGNSLQAEAVTTGKSNAISPLLQPNTSRFAKLVSSNTAVFVSTTGLTQTYNDTVKSNRADIDAEIKKSGQYTGLDDALKQLGQSLGLNNLQELIALFTGETAVAVQFPGSNLDAPQALVLAALKDEKQARDLFAKVANAAADSPPSTRKVGSVEITVFTASDTDLAYAVTDGYVAIGSSESVSALLQKKGPVLADLPGYKDTAAQLSGGLGTFAYIDLASLLQRSLGGAGDLGAAENALEGLVINLVNDHNLLHISGAVSVGK